jgi:EAL domain-containing protein (putative c-di-GMP-specific phosphodiesterase class I)
MYHAKEDGRNCYQFFSKTINDKATRRFAIETSLRKALDRGELSLSYQPRIDIQTYHVVGMEALLRWQLPDGGWVWPSEFVPIAEETGLIVPIGEWVFYQACRQAVEWSRVGLDGLTMSINLSAVQFKKKSLVDFICAVLGGTGFDPQHLELELTESLLIEDTAMSRSILEELKQYGLKVSLDDFGTGYSSLSYLKNFPFNALKLDQSLIQDVATNANDGAIVRATIALAHSLGLRIVAEGVEQQVQLDFLVTNGCDEAQGHLFTPALDVRGFERWMRNWPVRSRPVIETQGGLATSIEAA